MKLKNRALAASLMSSIGVAAAHTDEGAGAASGMMADGFWMHNAGHMTGYNMWGMGWLGSLLGIAIWILVILGIIYLYQQITENKETEGKE